MGDLIDRQAAIDALDVLCQEHRYRIPGKRETYSPYNEAWQDALDRAEGAIGNLPSAQPEPCEDVVSRNAIVQKLNEMDRYVSAELRLCDTDKKFPQNEVFIVDDVYEEIVEQLPSAQPEIIHCRDCTYYQTRQKSNFLPMCCLMNVIRDADDFCSRAERRTDERPD